MRIPNKKPPFGGFEMQCLLCKVFKVFVHDHRNKVDDPENEYAETKYEAADQLDYSHQRFASLETNDDSADPACDWNDCENQRDYPTKSKVRFICHFLPSLQLYCHVI